MNQKETVDFIDVELLKGAKKQAELEGKTFNQYVTDLIAADLKLKLQYKIIVYFESGEVRTEENFYTKHDLNESVYAYDCMYEEKIKLFEDSDLVIGFEVYKNGKLTMEKGRKS